MPGVTQKHLLLMYIFNCSCSIAIIEWVNDCDSQSKNMPAQRSPNKSKETKIKPCSAHGGYKASIEACFMDLGCFEKHTFSTALLEKKQKAEWHIAWFSINFHKASPLGPISGWAVIVPLRFQSCNICSYDKTDCYYK